MMHTAIHVTHPDRMLVAINKQGFKPYAGQDCKSGIPTFTGALSDKQIEAIVAYTKRHGHRGTRDSRSS